MSTPLYEQIYNHVLGEIRTGRLKSGDRVPSEKELAEQFGVSRITSKKALERLDQEHLIERMRGRGSFVAEALPEVELRVRVQEPSAGLIGLILPDFADTYGAQLLRAIEARAVERGCQLLLRFTSGRRDVEENAVHSLVQAGARGLIVVPVHGEFYNAGLLRLVVDGFPLVLVDRYLRGVPACAVCTDNRQAAFELTSYLLAQGHEQIGLLTPPAEHTSTLEDRLDGFHAALATRRLYPAAEHVLASLRSTMPNDGDTALEQDQEQIQALLRSNPSLSAFVALEYNLALLLASVLRSMNAPFSERTVVAFDSGGSRFGGPAFTHIAQDQDGMGRMAVDLLIRQLRGEAVPAINLVPHRLVVQSANQ